MREEKTFRVVVFRFETDASTNYTRYMITKIICRFSLATNGSN